MVVSRRGSPVIAVMEGRPRYLAEVAIADQFGGMGSLADACAAAPFTNTDADGAYYGSRRSHGPLHVQADPKTWQLHVANHTARKVSGASVTARIYDLSGRQLSHVEQQGLVIEPSSTAPAFVVSWPAGPRPLHLSRLELHDSDGALLAENGYWRYAAARDARKFSTLSRTNLSVSVHDVKDDGLKATVANVGATVAAMIRLALRDGAGGAPAPSAHYEDDYFWLRPGEARELSISWPAGATFERGPQVSVQAYNATVQSAH